MVLLWVYYTIIKFNINEKQFKYKKKHTSIWLSESKKKYAHQYVSSLTVSSPTYSRQPDSRTNHPQTNSIIARAQILIDLNQIKFDEEFDIYKIKEDNKDTRIVSKRENLYFCSCIAKTTCCHIVAVKLYNNEPIEYLISGNISIAVFQKNKRKKMGRKMKGHKKTVSQQEQLGVLLLILLTLSLNQKLTQKKS